MPSINRKNANALGRYWWVLGLGVLVLGGGSMMLFGPTGEAPVAENRAGTTNEQNLESLDAVQNPVGAPGGAIINLSMEGSGSYSRRPQNESTQASSLYQSAAAAAAANGRGAAPGAAGGAAAGGDKAAGERAGGTASLGEALKNAGKAGDGKGKGWGGDAARAGFTAPKASFGGMSGVGGSGGGSSGAHLSASTAFGTGRSDPGETSTVGLALKGGGDPRTKRGTNASLNSLRSVEAVMSRAAGSNSDMAANVGSQGYVAASSRPSGPGGPGGAAVGGGGPGSGVPDNLKGDDPKLQKKELKAPDVPEETKSALDKQAEQQKMMQELAKAVITSAVGGIAGQLFGSIGGGIASSVFGVGANAATSGAGGYGSAGSAVAGQK